MTQKQKNLQEAFLNTLRRKKVPVTVFLVNGVKLSGLITWFDNFCMLLKRDAISQLIYKHAVSTIMPSSPISFYDEEGEEETGEEEAEAEAEEEVEE